MAKDLPEYQRTTQITPAAQPLSFVNAASDVAASYESFGALSSQVASNMAQQRAQAAGQKAGKEPGQTFLPPFNAVDKTFNDAYRNESTKVLATNANSLMDKLTFEFGKNPKPTGSDLLRFEEEATRGLGELLELADPTTKEDLKRAFFQKFDSDFMALSQRVEKSDVENLLNNFNNSTNGNLINIFNYRMTGMDEAAEEAYQSQLKNLTSARAYIGEDKFVQGMLAAKMASDSAKYEAGVMDAYAKNGEMGAIDYIKDFAQKEHPSLTEAERDAIIPQIYNRYVQTQKINSLADRIEYGNAQIEMAKNSDGILPPSRLQHYQDILSTEVFNDLQLKQLAAQKKNLQGNEIAAFMNSNAENAISLSGLTDKQLDLGFTKNVQEKEREKGEPFTLADEANLAKTYDVGIPSFNKKISAGINSKNPEMAVTAANIYGALSLDNPNAIAGVDSTSALKANIMNSQIQSGTQPLEAWKYVSDKMDNLSKSQLDERKEFYKEIIKDSSAGLKTPSMQTATVAAQMGFNKALVPPGLVSDFLGAFQNNYIASGDISASLEQATNQMKQVYIETDVNGFKQVMYLAPTKHLPAPIVKDFILEDTKSLFEAQFKAFQDPDSIASSYYKLNSETTNMKVGIGIGYVHAFKNKNTVGVTRIDLDGKETKGVLLIAPDRYTAWPEGGKPPGVTRIDLDGKETKGVLLIAPDRYTEWPEGGKPPSYSMTFLPDGKKVAHPVYDPRIDGDNAYGNARFSLNPEKLDKLKAEGKMAAQKKKVWLDEMAKESAELRDKIISHRLEEGEEL